MLSLETARKLKVAGLKWEPQKGDWIYNYHGFVSRITLDCVENTEVDQWVALMDNYCNRTVIFAPRLDQLLAELRKHSRFVKITWLIMEEKWCCVIDSRNQFIADSPEEATAQALLWIYEQGVH